MQVCDVAAGVGGDDGRGLQFLAVWTDPALPQPGKGNRAAIFWMHTERPLARCALVLPLIKAVGRKEAAPPTHGIAKRRLVMHGFRPCIDEQTEIAGVLDPGWNEPPAHQGKLSRALDHAHDGHRLGGRHVVARRKAWFFRIAEEPPECLR